MSPVVEAPDWPECGVALKRAHEARGAQEKLVPRTAWACSAETTVPPHVPVQASSPCISLHLPAQTRGTALETAKAPETRHGGGKPARTAGFEGWCQGLDSNQCRPKPPDLQSGGQIT